MSIGKKSDRVLPSYRQVKAARQLIDWTQEDLAAAAGVGKATVERFEKGGWAIQTATLVKITEALERRGIVFTNGDSPTVSLQLSRVIIPPT